MSQVRKKKKFMKLDSFKISCLKEISASNTLFQYVVICLGLVYLSSTLASSLEENGEEQSRPTKRARVLLTANVPLNLPRDLLIVVGDFLEGKDFRGLVLTCHTTKRVLLGHSAYFIAADNEPFTQAIKNMPLGELEKFFSRLSRKGTREARVTQLRALSDTFNNYGISWGLIQSEADTKIHNLKMLIKVNRVLERAGDPHASEKLASIKDDMLRFFLTSWGDCLNRGESIVTTCLIKQVFLVHSRMKCFNIPPMLAVFDQFGIKFPGDLEQENEHEMSWIPQKTSLDDSV